MHLNYPFLLSANVAHWLRVHECLATETTRIVYHLAYKSSGISLASVTKNTFVSVYSASVDSKK